MTMVSLSDVNSFNLHVKSINKNRNKGCKSYEEHTIWRVIKKNFKKRLNDALKLYFLSF